MGPNLQLHALGIRYIGNRSLADEEKANMLSSNSQKKQTFGGLSLQDIQSG